MKYREVEFKYDARQISMEDFTQFCQDRMPQKFVNASGYDHFYAKVNEPGSFCRHRVGADSNQLTFKRKTDPANSYIRTEHNIDLDGTSEDQVKALCQEFGYEYTKSIFKNCFIYRYDYYILVYYICYDAGMQELGRFVEIEMREDYAWESQDAAWNALVTMERLIKTLGVSKDKRIAESLFEMFGSKDKKALDAAS